MEEREVWWSQRISQKNSKTQKVVKLDFLKRINPITFIAISFTLIKKVPKRGEMRVG